MPVKCSINGFGRIGRGTFKYIVDQHADVLDIVHVNDVCAVESAAYLLQYDSVHGTWPKTVEMVEDGGFTVDGGQTIKFTSQKDFTNIDYASMGVQMVLECTGKFLKGAELQQYMELGIPHVVVSAPVKEKNVLNVVIGCNDDKMEKGMPIVTNASCTTNCLAPVVKVMQESFGIVHGCITTIHDVTGTQTIVDMPNTKKSDLRRARSGMVNLCPTSTGSATAIIEIYPELAGKLNGVAVRVPLLNGSITDCVFELQHTVTVDQVNAALQAASARMPHILGYETKPLVSADYTNDTRSGIVDALSTQVIDGTLVKVLVWYDNEAGYSKRMAELCVQVAQLNELV